MMLIKTLKIYFWVLCFAVQVCVAQEKSSSGADLVKQYNEWLAEIKLNKLIRAKTCLEMKELSQTGSMGTTTFKNVTVLTLVPDSSNTALLTFAKAWGLPKKEISDDKIYELLFTKFADYYGAASDQLVIRFSFNDSQMFSFLIYFDKGIKVNKAIIEIRGNPDEVEPGDLDDNTVGGVLNNVEERPDLEERIAAGLSRFFKTHKHKSPVVVERKDWGSHNIRFKSFPINGEVTGSLHEIIIVNVITQPLRKGYVDVSFFFTVLCAGGIFSAPSDIDEYRDALSSHKKQVAAYGIRLKQNLRTIVNAK